MEHTKTTIRQKLELLKAETAEMQQKITINNAQAEVLQQLLDGMEKKRSAKTKAPDLENNTL